MHQKSPLKIMYVENGIGYGGAVICLRHLVRNLEHEKYEPVVVTSRTGREYNDLSTEAQWYHFPDRVIDLEWALKFVKQSSFWNSCSVLRTTASQCLARLDDLINFMPFFLWLLLIVARTRPSLIHVNNEPLCNRAGILIGKTLGLPVICHVRGNIAGSRMMKWLYRLPDHFIPVSHWVSKAIGELGIPEAKKTVVYDGIAFDKLDPHADASKFRKTHGVPAGAFAVGLVGLLIPWKGQHLFLDAAKRLAVEIPELRMLIVGGTPEGCSDYERELKERVHSDGLEQVVIFTGHVDEMCFVYNGLDVVVSASTSPEPLGTMVIECMAMGRPLVVPNHGGGAEMNTDEETALFFRAGDASDLSNAILRMHRDSELRNRLGRNAREKALTAFDITAHARRVQEVYGQVLRSCGSSDGDS